MLPFVTSIRYAYLYDEDLAEGGRLKDVQVGHVPWAQLRDTAISGGTHTSRTIMLADLQTLLATCPADSTQAAYSSAIVDGNVLAKKTLNSRQRSRRYLRELYALDPQVLLFRALRDLWEADPAAQPLLAILCALARDPSLGATAAAVLPLAQGEQVTADDLAEALMDRYPGSYSWAVAHKVGRNAASSWTQSGHLRGRTGKVRATATSRPTAVAYALLLGYLGGARGDSLFGTIYARALDASTAILTEQAVAASQRGLIAFRQAGGVTDVGFRGLTGDPPRGSRS